MGPIMSMNWLALRSYLSTRLQTAAPRDSITLKLYLEAQECEVIFTVDAPPELRDYETIRITHKAANPFQTPCCAAPTLGPTAATSFTASSNDVPLGP